MEEVLFSVIIPTVKFNKYLDEAIQSCFDSGVQATIVVWVNNCSYSGFEQSDFYKSSNVQWMCIGKNTVPMFESWNAAIANTKSEWCFLLSDDDLLIKGFLEGVDLERLNKRTLYASTINIINEDSEYLRGSIQLPKSNYESNEAIELYFKNRFHHHLSLFVFSREMFNICGGFVFTGYPNGYYLDTVFHGKLLAECDGMIVAHKPVFSRREFIQQASAGFYFSDVSEYFDIICLRLFENEKFKIQAVKRFGSITRYKKDLMQHRFYTEWYKLNNNVFNTSFKDKVSFFKNVFWGWELGGVFKIKSVFRLLFISVKSTLPEGVLLKCRRCLKSLTKW
ncbi:MAG: glycosyltransferase family 2 protein [Oceanospirillaceae bacterium]|nr:glycosyltransferase family 2 protein [Colwellia sp.]NQZ32149.1 glycosyltransferase family 2 protein [Oceanospirillaceae bacterium]